MTLSYISNEKKLYHFEHERVYSIQGSPQQFSICPHKIFLSGLNFFKKVG